MPAAIGAGPAYAERSVGAGWALLPGWDGVSGGGYSVPAGTLDGGAWGLDCWRAANAGSTPAPTGLADLAAPAAAGPPDAPLGPDVPPAALAADLPCPGVGRRFRVRDPSGLVWARRFTRCPIVQSMPWGSSNKRPRKSKASWSPWACTVPCTTWPSGRFSKRAVLASTKGSDICPCGKTTGEGRSNCAPASAMEITVVPATPAQG